MRGAEPKGGAMGYCAVVDCEELGMNVVTMPTSWGAWEHWICDPHKARVDDGAILYHDPAYRVLLHPPAPETARSGSAPASTEQFTIPEQTRGSDGDAHHRPRRRRTGSSHSR